MTAPYQPTYNPSHRASIGDSSFNLNDVFDFDLYSCDVTTYHQPPPDPHPLNALVPLDPSLLVDIEQPSPPFLPPIDCGPFDMHAVASITADPSVFSAVTPDLMNSSPYPCGDTPLSSCSSTFSLPTPVSPASPPSYLPPPTASRSEPSTLKASTKKPSETRSKSHARKRPDNHIPRPPNSWLVFRSWCIEKRYIPASVEKDQGNVSRILSHIWKGMSEEEKAPFFQISKELKEEHARLYPGYRYQPGKEGTRKKKLPKKEGANLEVERAHRVAELYMSGYQGEALSQAVAAVEQPFFMAVQSTQDASIAPSVATHDASTSNPPCGPLNLKFRLDPPRSSTSSTSRRKGKRRGQSSSVQMPTGNDQFQMPALSSPSSATNPIGFAPALYYPPSQHYSPAPDNTVPYPSAQTTPVSEERVVTYPPSPGEHEDIEFDDDEMVA